MASCLNVWNVYSLVLITQCVMRSNQVPAKAPDKFYEEITDVKNIMATISGELSKFNSLYLNKLETRMVTVATLLANLDSNVKNLQERAHVWDTFQLHVAAWNEQINTLDRKVDFLSRGQEKMSFIDNKISTLVNLDYKVERLVRKMDEADNKLSIIVKTLDYQRNDPLFGDFATRGILSTLKNVEKKVDHMEGTLTQMKDDKLPMKSSPKSGNETIGEEDIDGGGESVFGRGKLTIKCNTPVVVEELLHDIASKIDVIFDKFGQEDAMDVVTDDGEEQLDEPKDSVEEAKVDAAESKLLNKLWRRLTTPHKKTTRLLQSIEKSIGLLETENRTRTRWDYQTSLMNDILTSCKHNGQVAEQSTTDTELILKRIEQNLSVCSSLGREDMDRHFREQQLYLERVFQKMPRSCERERNGSDAGVRVDQRDENSTGIPATRFKPWGAQGCEDLRGTNALSGVYSFDAQYLNAGGRDYSLRFCDMDQATGGGWTVIQRRGYYPEPRQNFTVTWGRYRHGFGHLDEEFWFGNDYIHRLTSANNRAMVLRVELENFERQIAWAEYSTFMVDDESDGYRLRVGGFTGNATDSLAAHDGKAFSTIDITNDAAPACCPCAPAYGGGWWFYSCFEANLNGEYYEPGQDRDRFRGLIWEHWMGDASLRSTKMMIRPRDKLVTIPESTTENIPEDP